MSAYDYRSIKPSVYGFRRTVVGNVVALLDVTFKDRGLKLIETKSRAMRRYEVHELMITDEAEASPGGGADRVSAIAFFEIEKGGLIVEGDDVYVNGEYLGELAGYDLTHMPNHMNILVKTGSLEAPQIRVGDSIVFKRKR